MNVGVAPTSQPMARPFRRVVASAPMRVSFAGGGTDHPPVVTGHAGRVVGTAIAVRVRVLVEPFDPGWVRLDAPAVGRATTRRRSEPARGEPAFRLLEAALAEAGVEDGVRLEVETSVVPGAGLGGSASAAVASLVALRASCGESAALGELARQAMRIERVRLGIAGGAQDQHFAAYGGMLDLCFDERGGADVARLDAPRELVDRLAAGLLLVDTRVRRVSGEVLDRLDAESARRAVAELVAGAAEVAEGFASGSLERVLAGMRRSAAAKARRDPLASAIALDLGDTLARHGAEVVRMCGAGAGGHVLVWAPPERHGEIAAVLGSKDVRRPAIDAPGVRIEA